MSGGALIDETLRRRFERRWRDGRPEPIEAVMADCASEHAAATLEELLHIELEFRTKAGEQCTAADLLARFPQTPPAAAVRLRRYEHELRDDLDLPQRIGPYRIVRELGAGAMGKVYLAEQPSPRRRVALKVLNPLLLSREVMRRFEQEAQVLGRLQHPGIARIFEAGLHAHTPYIAMEFVDGPTLDVWVDEARPPLATRLETFIRICDGVTHAHQRGVIHRDLKPSNIVIETIDGRASPRILDFGLARLVDEDQRCESLRTGTGQILGTLQYMSPEQTAGGFTAVETGADVYALGAILHEMLSGERPYALAGLPIAEALQVIRDRDPVRLTSIDPTLNTDLSTIVAVAMEKDPDRRYASVAAMADDVRAFLDDRPIDAHPPSTIYQLRKFARRNRLLVSAAGVVALVLVVATIVSASQAITATRALAKAERQARIAAAVNEFLTDDLIAAANPYAADRETPEELTVLQVLDTAAETVHARFGDEPVMEAAVRLAIGRSYLGLGRHQPGIEQLMAADAMLERAVGPDEPLRLEARFAHGSALFELGQYALVEPLLLDVIERRRRVLGEDHVDTLEARSGLSYLYWFTRRLDDAEAVRRDVLARQQRALGREHPQTIESLAALAELLRADGRRDEAEPLFLQAIAAMRRDGERLPVKALAHVQNFSILYYDLGRFDEAETLKTELVESARRLLGEEHPETLKYRASLGEVWRRQGRLAEAEAEQKQVLQTRRRTIGPRHPWTLSSHERLADVYYDQGRFDEAETLLAAAVAIGDDVLPEGFWYRSVFRRKWGRCLAALERWDEAEAALLQAYDELSAADEPRSSQVRATAESLAELYAALDRDEQSRRWRAIAAADEEPTSGNP